jgi:hypothetical protein
VGQCLPLGWSGIGWGWVGWALEHLHSFGPIHETMQILQYQVKGAHLNTIQGYFIYKEFSKTTT